MSKRAFIIAIEKYNEFLPDLQGVNKEAKNFREWLINNKGIAASDIYACVEGDFPWRTAGTSSREIIAEIRKLKDQGANTTEELYFYFSGHGFSSPITPDRNVDVLVASDFDSLDAGSACISLDEIKEKLYRSLGPGDHYYFIDACRNPLDVSFSNMGIRTTPSDLGTPSIYRLFSTPQGVVAKTKSGFSQALINGLKGDGIAKEWRGKEMWVVFDRLCEYVKTSISQQQIIYNIEGTGEGRIFNVMPVPKFDCHILIDNAAEEEEFEAEISTVHGFAKQQTFVGSKTTISGVLPGEYYISVKQGGSLLVQQEPPYSDQPLLFYTSREFRFAKEEPAELEAANDLGFDELESISFSAGDEAESLPDEKKTLGIFQAIREHTSDEVLSELAGSAKDSNLGDDYDVGLWLSLMGASKIALKKSDYQKLFNLELPSFENMRKGESMVFVLGGTTAAENSSFEITLDDKITDWQKTSNVNDIAEVFETSFKAEGSHLLSIKRPNIPTFTYSIFCLPNRVTLFVITEDADKQLRIQQFVLPARRLIRFLPPEVVKYGFKDNPVKIIKSVTLAQRQFALKRELTDKNVFSENDWMELIYGKWLDPVMSLIGAYELLRRGQRKENNKNLLKKMVKNLRKYFPGIPDTEAIAKLIGEDWHIPQGPPILLDGILAFDIEEENVFAPPAEKLDYSSPWTRWFGIVDG